MAEPVLRFAISAQDESAPELRRVADALKELGIDVEVITDGMTASETKIVAAFTRIAQSTKATGDQILTGLVAAIDRIHSPAGVNQLIEQLDKVKTSGKVTGEGLDRLSAAEERLTKLSYAASQGEAAFTAALQKQKLAAIESAAAIAAVTDVTGLATVKFVEHRLAAEATAGAYQRVGTSASASAGMVGGFSTAINAMMVAMAAKQVLDMNDSITNLQRGLTQVTGSSKEAGDTLNFIRGVADRLGVSILDLGKDYLKLSAAAVGTQLEGSKTKQVFESVVSAMAQVGATADETNHALLAISQMISKGTVSAEELRRQLGESLPGAMQQAAMAMLKTNAEFVKMVQSGSVIASEFLPKFAVQLDKTFGGGQVRIDTFAASWNRLMNSFTVMSTGTFGQGFSNFTKALLNGFGSVIRGAGAVADSIGGVVKAAAGLAAGDYEDAVQDLGDSFEKSAAQLYGFKTQQEVAAEQAKQMKDEIEKSVPEIDRLQDAVDRKELKELPEHLQKAIGEFRNTGDAIKATQDALSKFMTEPAKKIDMAGVIELATSIKAVGQEATNSANLIQDTLAKELAKLSDDVLKKLEENARKAMAAASNNENARRAFADLGQIIEAVTIARLQRLGADAELIFKGLSIDADQAIKDFTAIGEAGQISGANLEKAFDAALIKLNDPKELAIFKAKILELGESGKLSGAEVDKMLTLIRIRAKEVASDPAFSMIVKAFSDIRTETERNVTVMREEMAVMDARIKGSQELAKARKDEAGAAQAAALAAKQELDTAKLKIDQYREQATQIDIQIQKLYEQANADGHYDNQERETIETLKQKSLALKSDAAEMEAHIPLLQREADETARMAGPVGELIRLYRDKAQAAQLQLNAINRYYDLQEKVIETEIAEAKAKNDTAEVIKLKNEQVDLEVKKSQEIADATIAEANAQIELLNAKKINILASDEDLNAKLKEIDVINDLIGKLQEQALAAQEVADKTKAEADAQKNANEAGDKAAETNEKISESADKAKDSTESLNVAMIKFGEDTAFAFGASGISRFNELVRQVESSINEANDAAERLGRDGLAAGVGNAESLVTSLRSVKGYLQDAANTAADNLLDALQSAREEARGLAEDLASMSADFEREMLQIKGDQAALEDLEYRDKLAKLEELHKRAGNYADGEYSDAVSKLNSLHQMKLDKLRQEEEERARNAQAQNASTNETSGAMSGLADQVERAHRAISAMGASDLSGLYNQMESLGQAARGLAGAL